MNLRQTVAGVLLFIFTLLLMIQSIRKAQTKKKSSSHPGCIAVGKPVSFFVSLFNK